MYAKQYEKKSKPFHYMHFIITYTYIDVYIHNIILVKACSYMHKTKKHPEK